MRFPRVGIKKEFWVGKAKRRRKIMMRLGKREQVEKARKADIDEKAVSRMVEMLRCEGRVLMMFSDVWMRVGEVVLLFYMRP